MKHLSYLTGFLFASLAAIPAFGQTTTNSFPKLGEKSSAPLMMAPPHRTPQAIDDKAKGITMYAGQLVSQDKKRGWIKFRTGKASDYTTLKNFTPEDDQHQAYGLYCSAFDGKDCYAIIAQTYTYGVHPLYFAKLNVATGDTTTIYKFNDTEKNRWYIGYDVYALSYDPKTKEIYGLGKDYETKIIDGEEKIVNAYSVLYTIDKNTGEFSKVQDFNRVYYNFSFDYDGNCYMLRPKAKSEQDQSIVGTELVKFNSDFNEVSVTECKSQWGETFIQKYFGTMSFDFTTGNLWWIPVGDYGATTLYTINLATGVYEGKSWFNIGNSFVGLTIPYMEADSRTAPAQVSKLDARADVNGAMNDTIKWENPTKAWNGTDLSDLKEVFGLSQKPNVATTELTSTETLLSTANADLIATIDATNKMGQPMQYVDANPYKGVNTYYVVASRVAGEKGVPDSIRCYMGVDVPGAVQNIQIKKKGTGIELSWEAPTKGLNNGFINESELTYTITRMPDNVVVAKDLTGTKYEDNTLGEQQKYSYKIMAKSNAGEGEVAESEGIMAGSALKTPIKLNFATQDDANRWNCPATQSIYFYYCGGYDEDSKCLIGYSNYKEAEGFVTSPPLKLEGGKTYRITTDFYAHQKETPFDLKLTMGTNGEDTKDATVIREEKDYSYKNMYTREVLEDMFTAPTDGTYYFGMSVATHNQYNNFRLFGLNVDYVADNDLKAFTINGIQAVVGYDNKCTVKVRNVGSKTQSKYSIKIYCDDEGTKTLVGETTNVPTLEAGKIAEVPVTFNPTKDGMFDFYAVVELEGDQEHSNDKTAVTRIKVNPEGTTPWTNIVTSGKDESEDTHGPSMNSDTYERTQSIYLASEIKADKDGNIKRLGYIYNANDNLKDRTDPFNAKIYLAHTDKESYTSSSQWLSNDELTLVYDGTFTLEPGRNNILAFDLNTPFKYDKTKNLIVVFEKEGAVPSNLMFCAVYKVFNSNASNVYRMLEYAEASPFDKTKSHAYNSAPVLYLGFDVANNISNANVASGTFFYNTNTDIIIFDKTIKVANFYSVDGKLVKTINAIANGRTKVNLPTGLYIVRTIDTNGVATSVKLNVNNNERYQKIYISVIFGKPSLYGGGLFAQTANEGTFKLRALKSSNQSRTASESKEKMRIGYCTTDVSRGLIAQITGSHTYHAATYLSADVLNKYVGDKIESIEFAISPKRGHMAEYFICTDLKDMRGTTLAQGATANYKDGWNKMSFKNPVTIKKDMNLYIGYILYLNDGEDYDCLLFDDSRYAVPGKNWYGYDMNWFNNTNGIGRNICVRAIVSGTNVPNNDVSLMRLTSDDGGEYVEQNKPKSYIAYIQNNGLTPINSLTVTVSAKGLQSKEVVLDGFNVPNNEPQKIKLDNISIPAEGNFTASFTITKVNGATDPDVTDNSAEQNGFSMKEGTSPVERSVLFEEFTSEGYNECTTADEVYNEILGSREDVVRVKHHLDYKQHKDQFRIPEETEYEQLYGKSKTFVPAIAVDRIIVSGLEDPGPAYFISDGEAVTKLVDLAKNVYSFVTLKAEPKVNGTQMNVKVSGHAGTNEMPLQTDLRLTTWLVEDNITSKQQEGKDTYIQNGVLRAVLSKNAWGDALDISGYDFEKNYSVTIKPEWNVKNMRVVSFVNNYDMNVERRTIYNTTQTPCMDPTGIYEQPTTANGNILSVVNGKILMSKGWQLVNVYDISGRNVNVNLLKDGLYILKATNGKDTITQKVCITH